MRPGTTKAPDGTVTVPTSDAKKYEPTAEELKAKAKAEGENIGLLGHEPVYDEAVLWLAKSLLIRQNRQYDPCIIDQARALTCGWLYAKWLSLNHSLERP